MYNNDGLTPEQIDALNSFEVTYVPRDGESVATITGHVDQFDAALKKQLERLGLNMNDPQTHFAVLAGASLVAKYITFGDKIGRPTDDTIGLVLGALVNGRPIRELE